MTSSPASGPWDLDDLVHAGSSGDWSVSRDGTRAAWVRASVERFDGELVPVANLWLTSLPPAESDPAGYPMGRDPMGRSRPLTRGRHEVSSPHFSPDGRRVAYLSDRATPGEDQTDTGKRAPGARAGTDDEPKAQVWVLPLDGGEPLPVTSFDRPVLGLGWAGDDSLVVLAGEARSAWDLAVEEARDRAVVVDDERQAPVRLYRVELAADGSAETVRRLTAHDDWGEGLAVSPDGRRAVLRSARSLSYEYDSRVPPVFRLVDLDTGGSEELTLEGLSGRALQPERIVWQGDSRGFYFLNERSHHERYRVATVSELHHHDVVTGVTRAVDLAHERGLGGPREMQFTVVPDGVFALLADGVHDRLAFFERRGAVAEAWVRHDLDVADADRLVAAPDGSALLVERSRATEAPRWFWVPLDPETPGELGEPVPLTRPDPHLDGKPTGRVEVIEFAGARGETVQGLLHYPLDWHDDSEPRPLVLDVHGGPAARDRDAWSQRWAEPLLLWRQRGAFVLQVNYHGSSGYGLEWASSIAGGNYYDLEVPDLEAGVDHVVERGLADPERLAAAGWSNGGILIAELLTRTGRYQAASIGAADVEWASDYGNVDFGATFDEYYFGAPPWEAPELYAEKSPLFRLDRVTTPTIVFTGTADTAVPPHQSRSLFRALQQTGKAPVRLVLFPDEPHSLRSPAHQRRKMEEDLAWFDRYLFDGPERPDPALKRGSLLAGALARQRAARDDEHGVLGVDAGGALTPEIVPGPMPAPGLAGLAVARFEVTQAQWTAFDPGVVPEPGREDHPATAMTFERARGYAAWLARTTGRPLRLPTVAEAKKLAELGRRSGTAGNTLDRWAGYSPNPDDARRLADAAAELPGEAPLLLPVGSLGGVGDDPVFDLDGNAATWAVDADGTGVAVGPSADRPAGGRTVADEAAPEYTGIRIVEEI